MRNFKNWMILSPLKCYHKLSKMEAILAGIDRMQQNAKIIVSLLIFSVLISGQRTPVSAQEAPSFTVKSGHPKVFINPERIAQIQAATAPFPSYFDNFPRSEGTLFFDFFPVHAVTSKSMDPIFDGYDKGRDHLFIRHYDLDAAEGECPLQIAFQAKESSSFVVASLIRPRCGEWHSVRVSWNFAKKIATVQLDSSAPIFLSSFGWPTNWTPGQQVFQFRGRGDLIANLKLYGSDKVDNTKLILDVPLDEGSGTLARDVLGTHLWLTNAPWVTRPTGGWAIQLNSNHSGIDVHPPRRLANAWKDQHGVALNYAQLLNQGKSPVDLAIGHPAGMEAVAKSLGLAWLITKDPQFKTALIILGDQLLVLPRDAGTVFTRNNGRLLLSSGDYPLSGRIEAMGIIYDWLYTDIPESYRDALAQAIKETVPYLEGIICGSVGAPLSVVTWKCANAPDPVASGGHSDEDSMRVTAALFAIIDEHPELQPLLLTLTHNLVERFLPLRAWVSIDGGHNFGWSYGSAYNQLYQVQLTNDLTNVPIVADWQARIIDRYIYGLRGDLTYPASGDNFDLKVADESVVHFALFASNMFHNAYAQDFYNRWLSPNKTGIRLNELLYLGEENVASPIEQLALSKLFRNAGQVLMRDSWHYPDATLLEFKSTSFAMGNHQHLDQNAFTVFYKSPLLIASGFLDSYGSSHWYNYYTRTIASNSLTVYDPSERYYLNGVLNVARSNDGGQSPPASAYPTLSQIQTGGSQHLDGVTAYEYNPDFTYVAGNASKAYSASKLDQDTGFIRNIIFLRSPSFWKKPVIIIFDKITAQKNKASLVKTLIFHTVNEPEATAKDSSEPGKFTLHGDSFTVRNGSGMLFVQTLLPATPLLTKIGGRKERNDYRFMAPDPSGIFVNYAPAKEPVPNQFPDVGAWRVQVTARTPSQREYFLHSVAVADNIPDQIAFVSENWSSSTAAVALLRNSYAVVFSKEDMPAHSLNWLLPQSNIPIIIAGLLPTSKYRVKAVKSTHTYIYSIQLDPNGEFTSSSQGILQLNGIK